MTTQNKYKAGDSLWYVELGGKKPEQVTVLEVGPASLYSSSSKTRAAVKRLDGDLQVVYEDDLFTTFQLAVQASVCNLQEQVSNLNKQIASLLSFYPTKDGKEIT